jgi:hypothetical protein
MPLIAAYVTKVFSDRSSRHEDTLVDELFVGFDVVVEDIQSRIDEIDGEREESLWVAMSYALD